MVFCLFGVFRVGFFFPCFANIRSFQYSLCRTPHRAETCGVTALEEVPVSFLTSSLKNLNKWACRAASLHPPCPLSKALHLPFPDGETAVMHPAACEAAQQSPALGCGCCCWANGEGSARGAGVPSSSGPTARSHLRQGARLAPLPRLLAPGWQTATCWRLSVTGSASCLLTGFYKAVLC